MPRRRNGFTLIEILIVIVIIGLLAFTLIPRILAAQQRARDTGRIADVRQIGMGLQSYIYTNNTIPSSAGTGYKDISSISGALLEHLKSIPDDKGRGLMVNSDGHCISSGDNYAYYVDGNKAAVTASMEGGKGNTAFCKGQVSTKMMFPKHSDGYNIDMGDYTRAGVNMLKWSEQFDNVAWVKYSQGVGSLPTVTANYGVAPDGTMTAERLQCNQVSSGYTNRSFVGQNTQVVNGQTYTTTLFVKSNTGTPQPFSVMDNRLNPLPGYSHQGIATDQWTRFVVKGVSIITAINTTRIGLIDSDAGTSNDILIWGAQFELDTTETSYDATTGTTHVGEMY